MAWQRPLYTTTAIPWPVTMDSRGRASSGQGRGWVCTGVEGSATPPRDWGLSHGGSAFLGTGRETHHDYLTSCSATSVPLSLTSSSPSSGEKAPLSAVSSNHGPTAGQTFPGVSGGLFYGGYNPDKNGGLSPGGGVDLKGEGSISGDKSPTGGCYDQLQTGCWYKSFSAPGYCQSLTLNTFTNFYPAW